MARESAEHSHRELPRRVRILKESARGGVNVIVSFERKTGGENLPPNNILTSRHLSICSRLIHDAMRTNLRLLALLLALAAAGGWYFLGANRGWTKTSVAVERTDEVTGLTVKDWEKKFVPGIELLAAGLGLSAALAAGSFLIRQPKTNS